jgi:predicted Rossmann fold flavoprotein
MTTPQTLFDAVVVGAGAAGLMCAGVAGQLGARVLVIDHYPKVAEKIRISGGGRCNFTNIGTTPAHFLSDNPHFAKSALLRYTPRHFIDLVQSHNIAFHEKHRGQLFCDVSAEQIIDMLLAECAKGRVERWQPCGVRALRKTAAGFELDTDQGSVTTRQLVIATGALSIPKIGATDFGYRVAKQFGHSLIEPRPGLVPLTFDAAEWQAFSAISGIALEAIITLSTPKIKTQFLEDLLFTHRGLSGPGVLQISSFWRLGDSLQINLLPQLKRDAFIALKNTTKKSLGNAVAELLPERLAQAVVAASGVAADKKLAETNNKDLDKLHAKLGAWQLTPNGSEGYRKAEVTVGGVNTTELNSNSLESKLAPGLHFIGEVVDVTGWLGGYNFQWAWASGVACGQALAAKA